VNKDLYSSSNGIVEFPKDMREHMKVCGGKVKNADTDTEGFKRNQELQEKQTLDYKRLKRIKNFFDNFKGNHKDPSFILNGGVEMKNWVNDVLRKMRQGLDLTKRNKADTGMQNQYIKPHEKKDFTNVRPSQKHASTLQKYDSAVTESLKRINELISKL
jgi:hypothetical protein